MTTGSSKTTPNPSSIASTRERVSLIVSMGRSAASVAMAAIAGNATGITRK